MKTIDMNNHHNQLIVAALAGMVEDEGMTVHEVHQRLEDIKRDTFPALMEIQREAKAKQK